jgi:hypothetical protein
LNWLKQNLNDSQIKDLKFFKGKKSYTINKKYVHICLYDKNKELYHKNQLMLVLLHEISHALCDEIGHTEKFNNILEELLTLAELHGIYDPSIPTIPDYCEY